MKTFRDQRLGLAGLGLLTGVTMAAAQGCDDGGPLGDLAEQCGLTCPAEGILEGNASISGVASVDAFFAAVINVRDVALQIEGDLRAELLAIAAEAGITVDAEASIDALGAELAAALTAKFEAEWQVSLSIDFKPAECKANLEVAASAAAECDVDVDPGEVSVKCEGTCEIDAEAQASCTGEATLKCSGKAPNLECSGTCSGTCAVDVSAGASCEGTCKGQCDGNCSLTNASGECEGECDATCTGQCDVEMKAGATCEGKCEGTCEYEPGGAECEAGAAAKCEGAASVDVECKGGCEGNVEPPEVKAECQASVEAKAEANVECTPPRLDVSYEFAGGVDAEVQAEFRAFLEGFKVHFSAILAIAGEARIDAVMGAVANLTAAASGAVKGAVEASAEGDIDLKASIGLACALTELEDVGAALQGAGGSLSGSVSAVASLTGSVG